MEIIQRTTGRQNELFLRLGKLFYESSTGVPALLPCSQLPRQARGTLRTVHFVSRYVVPTLHNLFLLFAICITRGRPHMTSTKDVLTLGCTSLHSIAYSKLCFLTPYPRGSHILRVPKAPTIRADRDKKESGRGFGLGSVRLAFPWQFSARRPRVAFAIPQIHSTFDNGFGGFSSLCEIP